MQPNEHRLYRAGKDATVRGWHSHQAANRRATVHILEEARVENADKLMNVFIVFNFLLSNPKDKTVSTFI